VGRTAQDKALRSRKPTAIEPGRYTVILEPAAVTELLWYLVGAMDARSADEGRSFFSKPGGGTKLGETLFGPNITIRSSLGDATLPCAPFAHTGLPAEAVTWIDKGRVNALNYSRFWAQKQGRKPTAAANTMELLGGEAESTDALLKGVKRGLLVTRFWYTNLLTPETLLATGLTRDGVFLVENGEVTRPVTNFRWNESPLTMLKNADAMTKQTFRVDGSTRVPALRTHDFHMASISDAV
jgi:predicted Zn-dependent protease